MNVLTEAFQAVLHERMAEQGLSNADLASRAGLRPETIRALRSGKYEGNLRTWVRLLSALDADLMQLRDVELGSRLLSRPIRPQLVVAGPAGGEETRIALSDRLVARGEHAGCNVWEVPLSVPEFAWLTRGLVMFQTERILERCGIVFTVQRDQLELFAADPG